MVTFIFQWDNLFCVVLLQILGDHQNIIHF